MEQQILKGLISEKVDELMAAFPAVVRDGLSQMDLNSRIAGVGILAGLIGENEVKAACNEWLKMVGA